MMSRNRLILSSLGLLIASTHALGSGTYYNLATGRTVTGVSADGTVAAGVTGTGQPYFIWKLSDPTITTLIGGVSPGSNVGGQAKVSDNGDKISGVVNGFVGAPPIPGTVVNQMAVYDVSDATWTGVGGIGWYSGTETSSGWAVSGDGTTLVGSGYSLNQTNSYASVSINGAAPTALPWLVPGRSTRANGCDLDGNVVVGWQDRPNGFRQAAVWTNGVGQRIWRTYPGQACGEAQSCSADGNWVVGNGGASATDGQAWRWSASTGVLLLGDVDATPSTVGTGTAISSDGNIIVGYEGSTIASRKAFLWTTTGGMQDLTAYVVAQGVTLPTTTPATTNLGTVIDVSDDGLTFVGIANSGFSYVVRLDPPPPFAPCGGDVNADHFVNVTDMLAVISAWGACSSPRTCAADFNGDGQVNVSDLLLVISAWGNCP